MSATLALVEAPRRIATPREHGAALHQGRRGHVTICHKAGRWRQMAYRVEELPDVLPALAGQADVYLSANRFWGTRNIARLAELGALFVDIDFHRLPGLAGMHPRGVLEDVLIAMGRARVPTPTLAIFSGRGLCLYWLHDPVPRSVLPRWNACQQQLYAVLAPFGADRGALDAARALRLVGTRNSRSGATVEALAPTWGEPWNFEDLAAEILPLERGELYDIRVRRAARAARRPSEGLRVAPEGYTAATLWEARLSDLQALRRLRWFGELPPGQRDAWMFIAGVGMSWIAEPRVLRRELHALAREAAGWSDREAKSRMQAIFKRAHAASRGEIVEWGGVNLDPRYRFLNQTIIEWLQITPDEERQMITLISDGERRRRERDRQRQLRREAGAMTREEYQAGAAKRRREAHSLRAEGLTHKRIAERLGISERHVKRLLAGG